VGEKKNWGGRKIYFFEGKEREEGGEAFQPEPQQSREEKEKPTHWRKLSTTGEMLGVHEKRKTNESKAHLRKLFAVRGKRRKKALNRQKERDWGKGKEHPNSSKKKKKKKKALPSSSKIR